MNGVRSFSSRRALRCWRWYSGRGIDITVVDDPSVCWSMRAPGLLLVDAESLSLDEVERLLELFDELQRRGVHVMLATAGLDRLDPEYVDGRFRRARSNGAHSGAFGYLLGLQDRVRHHSVPSANRLTSSPSELK